MGNTQSHWYNSIAECIAAEQLVEEQAHCRDSETLVHV